MLRYSFKTDKFENIFEIANEIMQANSVDEVAKLSAQFLINAEKARNDKVSVPAELWDIRQNIYSFFRLICYLKKMLLAAPMAHNELEEAAGLMVSLQKLFADEADLESTVGCYKYLLRSVMNTTANVATAVLTVTNGNSGRDISPITFLSVNHAQFGLAQAEKLNRKLSQGKIDNDYTEFPNGFAAFVNDGEPKTASEIFFFSLNQVFVELLLDSRMANRHSLREVVRINAQLVHVNLWQREGIRKQLTDIQCQFSLADNLASLEGLRDNYVPVVFGMLGRIGSVAKITDVLKYLKDVQQTLEKLYLTYKITGDAKTFKRESLKQCLQQMVKDFLYDTKFLLAAVEQFADYRELVEEIRIIDANAVLIESCVDQEPAQVGQDYYEYAINSHGCTSSGLLWSYKPHLQLYSCGNKDNRKAVFDRNIDEIKQMSAQYHASKEESQRRRLARLIREQYISCLTAANAQEYQGLDDRQLQDVVRSIIGDQVSDAAYNFLASVSGSVINLQDDLAPLFVQIIEPLKNLYRCRVTMTYVTFADFIHKARTLLTVILQGRSTATEKLVYEARSCLDSLEAFCRNDYEGAMRYVAAINHAENKHLTAVKLIEEDVQQTVTVSEYFELALGIINAEEPDLAMQKMRLASLPKHPNILLEGELALHQTHFNATLDLLHIMLQVMLVMRRKMLNLPVSAEELAEQSNQLLSLKLKARIREKDTGYVFALKCFVRFATNAISLLSGIDNNDVVSFVRRALLEARQDQIGFQDHPFIFAGQVTSAYCVNLINAHLGLFQDVAAKTLFNMFIQDLHGMMLNSIFTLRRRFEAESLMSERILKNPGANITIKQRQDCLARIQRLAELDALMVRWNLSSVSDKLEKYKQYQVAHPLDEFATETIAVSDKANKLPVIVSALVFGDNLAGQIKSAIQVLIKRVALLEIAAASIFMKQVGDNRDNMILVVTREHDRIICEIEMLVSDINFQPTFAETLKREKEVLALLKFAVMNYLGNLKQEFPTYLLNEMLDFKIDMIKFDSYMNADIAKSILSLLFKRFDYIVLKADGLKYNSIFDLYAAELKYLMKCHAGAVTKDNKLLVSRFILEYFYAFAITFRKLGFREQLDKLKVDVFAVCKKDSILPVYDLLLRSNEGLDVDAVFNDMNSLFGHGGSLLEYFLRFLSSRLYTYLNIEFNGVIADKVKSNNLSNYARIASARIVTTLLNDNNAKLSELVAYIEYLSSQPVCEVLTMLPHAAAKAAPVKIEAAKEDPVLELNPESDKPVMLKTRTFITVDTSQGMAGILRSLKGQFDSMRLNHRMIVGDGSLDVLLDGVEEKVMPVIKEVREKSAAIADIDHQPKPSAIVAEVAAEPKPVFDLANADFLMLTKHCHADDADECFKNIATLCQSIMENGKAETRLRAKSILFLAQALMFRIDDADNLKLRNKFHKLVNQYAAYLAKHAPEMHKDGLLFHVASFETWLAAKDQQAKAVEQVEQIAEAAAPAQAEVVGNNVKVSAEMETETNVVEVTPAPAVVAVVAEVDVAVEIESDVPVDEVAEASEAEASSEDATSEDDLPSEASVHSEVEETKAASPEVVVADPIVFEPFEINTADINTVIERCHDVDADTEFNNIYELLRSVIFDASMKKDLRVKAVKLLAQALLHRINEMQDQAMRDKAVNVIVGNKSYAEKGYAKQFAACLRDVRKYTEFLAERLQQVEAQQAEVQQEDVVNEVLVPLVAELTSVPEQEMQNVAMNSVPDAEPQRVPTPRLIELSDVEAEQIQQPPAPPVFAQPSPRHPPLTLSPVSYLESRVNRSAAAVRILQRNQNMPALRAEDTLAGCDVPKNNRLLQSFVMAISPLQTQLLDALGRFNVDAYLYDDSVCSSLFHAKPGHMKLACFAAPEFICMILNNDTMKRQLHIKEISASPNQDGLLVRLDEAGVQSFAQYSKTPFNRADLLIEIKCLVGFDKKVALRHFCFHQRLNSMLFWSVTNKKLIDVAGNANAIAVYPEFHMHRKFNVMPVLDLCEVIVPQTRDNREIIFDALLKLSRHHLYLRFGMALNVFIGEQKHELRDRKKPPFLIELFDELFLTHTAAIAGRYMKQDRQQDVDLDILYDLFPMLNPDYESDFRLACAQSDQLCMQSSYHNMSEEVVNHARASFFVTAFYRSFMHGKTHWDYVHEHGQQKLLEQLVQFLYQMPFDLFNPHHANLLQTICQTFMHAFEQEYIPGFYNAFMSELKGRSFTLEQYAEFKEEYTAFLFQTGVMDNQWIVEKVWYMHVHMLNQQVAAEAAQALAHTQVVQASPRLN